MRDPTEYCGNRKKHRPPEGSCWKIIEANFKKELSEGKIYFGKNGDGVPRRKNYLKDTKGVVPWSWWPHEEVGHTDEAKREIRTYLDTQTAFDTPKPIRLMSRVLQIATDKDSIVLDSFAGSGTTGHAVLAQNKTDNGSRRFILVEMDKEICENVTAQRLTRASNGYKDIEPLNGGIKFCNLGESLFDNTGQIAKTVSFIDLARFVFFKETGLPLTDEVYGKSTLIGTNNSTGIYLLYNGILGDKTPQGGNVLTRAVLASLPPHDGPKVVYGTSCRVGLARLKQENVIFRQIPYELKVD